jgi:lipoyl(octanoyl) transferase
MSERAEECSVVQLGRLDYGEANELQERVRDAREAGLIGDTLLLLEHNPVYTRGRRSSPEELPHEAAWYAARGIEIVDVNRGGRVTYHAPGQLVGYPIVKTSDVVAHVRSLERVIITALGSLGVEARARVDEGSDFTGVWVGQRKIASIGVHLRRSITTHGFAINLEMDLEPWQWIVPCGLQAEITSVAAETGAAVDEAAFTAEVSRAWADELGAKAEAISSERLARLITPTDATLA